MLLMTVLFAPEASTSWANATDEGTPAAPHMCLTADDLDFDGCKPEQLSVTELKSICDGIGLDAEKDVFPFLFASADGKFDDRPTYTQEDYAAAAYECILVSEQTDSHFDEGFILEVLEESPEVLINIVTDVMESTPGLIEELIKELQDNEPDVWKAIEEEMTTDQSLLDKPEVVSELVKALLHHHADLFELDDHEFEDEDDDDEDEMYYDDDEDDNLEKEL